MLLSLLTNLLFPPSLHFVRYQTALLHLSKWQEGREKQKTEAHIAYKVTLLSQGGDSLSGAALPMVVHQYTFL